MPIYANINGVQKRLSSINVNIDGSNKFLSNIYTNIDGYKAEIFCNYPLGNFTLGSVFNIYTTLSGTSKPTEFIMLGNSEQGNSTLLLQKYLYKAMVIYNDSTEYSSSNIDKYLQAAATESDSYRSKLPKAIQDYLVKTTIESYSYNSNTMLELDRDIFLMSATEASETGKTGSYFKTEGISRIDYLVAASSFEGTSAHGDEYRMATTEDGTNGDWLLRSSPDITNIAFVDKGGTIYPDASFSSTYPFYIRPILSFDPMTPVAVDNNTFSILS